MKNLKKVLALVLVVAMMASFAVSASAASFTDQDEIVYDNAVDLLSALDVVNGFTDGSYMPEGNVTRAQTAKMIAFIMNGGEDASSTFAASAKFNDVADGYWAANSIGYCAAKEIVAGAGNNMYYPNNDVTGVQLAKMALVALGYDPTIEGLTGSAWAVNTINLAEDAGLFDGMNNSFNASAAASRQEAAQILYNMLLSEMVCYTDNGTNIIIGDITINTNATRKYMNKDGEAVEKKSDAIIGIEEYFDVTSNDADDVDDYGRPARIINVKGMDDEIVLPKDADVSYEGKVKGGDLYSAIGKTASEYKLIINVDGATVYDETNKDEDGKATEAAWADLIAKGESDKLGYTGATLNVYVDDDAETLTLVVLKQYLAQVESVDENKDDEDLIDVDLDVFGESDREINELDAFGYEEDDYVIVIVGANKAVTILGAAESVEGVAATQSGSYYKVDGTQYDLSAVLTENPAAGDYTGTYTFYLDQMGNLVGSVEIAAGANADKYLYVNKTQADSDIDGAWVKANVDFADGTSATIELVTKNTTPTAGGDKTDCYKLNNNWYAITTKPAGENSVFANGFYSYTKDSDGYYTLKSIDTSYVVEGNNSDLAEILDGDTDVSNSLRATTSTKLVLVDSDTTYTGYKNFPDSVKGDDLHILLIRSSKNSSNVSAIYIFNEDGAKEAVTIAMYTGTTETRDGDDYAEFYIDGAKEFKKITSVDDDANSDKLTKYALYQLDGEDAIAIANGDTEYDNSIYYNVVTGTVTKVEEGSYFELDTDGDDEYDVTFDYGYDDDDLLVYDATNDGAAADLDKNDVVTVAYVNDNGNYALVVFITD